VAEIFDLEIVDASNTARFPEGMLGSAINNGARALEGLLARWYEDTDGSITSGGSANAYTLTSRRTIASLVNNTVMVFTSNFANTGAATLAFNGLTAKSIKRPNGDALAANDIVSGQVVAVIYKSSPDEWRMLSPGKFSASDTVAGALEIAVQSEMEAAASAVLAVTPGRQHFHPMHPKAGGNFNGSGTPAFRSGDYGMGVITDGGTGIYTLALDTAFADTNYWCTTWARLANGLTVAFMGVTAEDAGTKTTSSFAVSVRRGNDNAADSSEVGITFWGDYA
jgi:hypothetical protein